MHVWRLIYLHAQQHALLLVLHVVKREQPRKTDFLTAHLINDHVEVTHPDIQGHVHHIVVFSSASFVVVVMLLP